ncbi:regulator, partial [Escherichia coli]
LSRKTGAVHLNLSEKAISLSNIRNQNTDECSGSICLPNVALYAAGYRKSKQLTAR